MGNRLDDRALKRAQWERVAEAIGKDAAAALFEHYSMFDERFYLWLAGLYDGEVGGFYLSNSARDNEFFRPDIESTVQALYFLDNSGLCASVGGWKNAFSKETEEKLLAFARSLQSPDDGYFYHPQWEGLRYPPSRLARDIGWATHLFDTYREKYDAILKAEGISDAEREEKLSRYMPDYNTPSGKRGRYGEPRLGKRDGDGASGSEKWTPQLRSTEAWREYLASKDLAHFSYRVGNEVSSQSAQIRLRDKEAAEAGEPTGYEDITREFFNSAIRSDNGLWEDTVRYNSVNGIMKISGIYNSLGWELPYAERGFESALEVAMNEGADCEGKYADGAVDVYNPWVVISQIFTNWRTCYKDRESAERLTQKYKKLLSERSADMIRVTTEKTRKFIREDGSYGYSWPDRQIKNKGVVFTRAPREGMAADDPALLFGGGALCCTSQGMPVSIAGIVEGDVNGGCISSTGIIKNMTIGLGISNIKPAIYYSADLAKFLEAINDR